MSLRGLALIPPYSRSSETPTLPRSPGAGLGAEGGIPCCGRGSGPQALRAEAAEGRAHLAVVQRERLQVG